MRIPLIVGNWKMNLRRDSATALARGIRAAAEILRGVELAVCPPSIYLESVSEVLQGGSVGWGAQNLYFEAEGAYTGEISATMLVDLGCKFVIVGHSERRHVLGETDRDINRKIKSALGLRLTPIFCVGELIQDREAGHTMTVIQRQFHEGLEGIDAEEASRLVIAYEPVWAIGTGKVASPEQAEEVHAALRELLQIRYTRQIAEQVRIQYGGSVKPANAAELMAQPNIDGALVGGASLTVDGFMGIAAAAQSSGETGS